MFILSFLLPIHDDHVFSYPITIRTESFYIEEISNDQLEKYIHKIINVSKILLAETLPVINWTEIA